MSIRSPHRGSRGSSRRNTRVLSTPAENKSGPDEDAATGPTAMREPVDSAPTQRQAMIAVAAYFLAESRGFIPGRELDDWLAAERAIDHALAIEPLEIGVWK